MKYGLGNLGNPKVIVHYFIFFAFIIYNGIEDFSTNLRHAMISRVMTLRNKKFEKYEICVGLYNSLLCVIQLKINSNFITYPKRFFHDQY
jgi:hypothetical protein